jgi:hypothetical protein
MKFAPSDAIDKIPGQIAPPDCFEGSMAEGSV